MNRRIKKKVAKRQLIKDMQGLVDLAQEWERREEERTRRLFSYPKSDTSYFHSRNAAESEDNLWHFSILQSTFYRLWLSHLAQGLVYGALSICLRATATTIRAQMLMCGKVT